MATISERTDADALDDADHFLVRQPGATGEKTRKISFADLKNQIPGTGSTVQSGKATLSSGTATITSAWVTTNSRIVVTPLAVPGVPSSTLYIENIVASTSFDITSEDATDTRDVFWLATEEAAAPMVLMADATSAPAYVTKDYGSDQSEVWISFGLAYAASAQAFWDVGPDGSGDFATVLSSGDAILGAVVEFTEAGPTPNWYMYGGSSNDEQVGPPAPTPDAWQDCELHLLKTGTTTVEFYVATTLVTTFTDAETFGIRKLSVGQRGTPTNGADNIVYIRDVKVGTTRGASNLFADDFSSGDLSNWDATTGACTVVTDPF